MCRGARREHDETFASGFRCQSVSVCSWHKAADRILSVGALARLGQGEEPGRAGSVCPVLRIEVLRGIRLSEHLDGTDGETVFQHACRMGLEGIVAKRRDRPYRSGRSPDWVKVKNPDAPAATRVLDY